MGSITIPDPPARRGATGVAAGPPRLLARRIDDPRGPWLIAVAGIHGNEPAGVAAVARVAATLAASGERLGGAFVAFAGNLGALAAGRRFVERDLNRAWTAPLLARARSGAPPANVEEAELAALDRELERALGGAGRRVFLLDLHTTSGAGPPFVVLDDALPNRRFALAFPVPLVLGLEEELAGTLVFHLTGRGVTGLAFEAGRHDETDAVDHAEAALWIALEAAGVLPRALRRSAESARQRLRARAAGLPHLVEVHHRQRLAAADGFRMRPGFAGFTRVEAGQPLADDAAGEIRAPRAGLVLMPLYQDQGEDGFFLAAPVARLWFELSAALRRIGAARWLGWLPGVRRRADGGFEVDRRVARVLVGELFHLLGYRRVASDPERPVYHRRAEER